MEEVVATIFLRRLNSLLCEEFEIFGGLEDEILLLKSQLSYLNSQIPPFQRELIEIGYFRPEFDYFRTKEDGAMSSILSIELEESIHNWLVWFRETIHDVDDCIELFIIRMNNNSKDGLDDSDRIVATALLKCELRIINKCLVEILDAKPQLDTSIASLSIEHSENSFIQFFFTLPIDLKSCFMYTWLYLQHSSRDKGNLVELLMAEGLIEEIPGERIEDIVESNINKLIERGMVCVLFAKWPDLLSWSGTMPNHYRHFDAVGDEYLNIIGDTDTNIPFNIRHVRIFASSSKIASFFENIRISSIRSLFITLLGSSHLNPLEKLFNLKLLRVLDLNCFHCYESNIIIEVGNLIHLRYLYLKSSNVKKLPESIGNLRNLRTLKIACPKLKELPSGILHLLQLRHLKIYNFKVQRSLGLVGIGRLTNLQTLSGIDVGDGIASELSNLTQIKDLQIDELAEEDASELYASIMKMTGLLSLSLSATCEDHFTMDEDYFAIEDFLPSLEPFSPPPLLQKLSLAGWLQEMPDWFSSMKNLTQLVLTNSDLLESPASVLESLPNLKFLKLHEAYIARYIGREFCGSGGFPSLETLIVNSKSLIEWTELEEGSFRNLKFLYLGCPSLTTLPEGLQLITTLQKLDVEYLHDDLRRKLSSYKGPEYYKIKHIPSIMSQGHAEVKNWPERISTRDDLSTSYIHAWWVQTLFLYLYMCYR